MCNAGDPWRSLARASGIARIESYARRVTRPMSYFSSSASCCTIGVASTAFAFYMLDSLLSVTVKIENLTHKCEPGQWHTKTLKRNDVITAIPFERTIAVTRLILPGRGGTSECAT